MIRCFNALFNNISIALFDFIDNQVKDDVINFIFSQILQHPSLSEVLLNLWRDPTLIDQNDLVYL